MNLDQHDSSASSASASGGQGSARTSNSTSPFTQRSTTTYRTQRSSLTTIVKAQVTLLVTNLTNENYTHNAAHIRDLVETHGAPIRLHLLRSVFNDSIKPLAEAAAKNQTPGARDATLTPTNLPAPARLLKENVQSALSAPENLECVAEAFGLASRTEIFKDIDVKAICVELGLDEAEIAAVVTRVISDGRKEVAEACAPALHLILQTLPPQLPYPPFSTKPTLAYILTTLLTFCTTPSPAMELVGVEKEDVDRLVRAARDRYVNDENGVPESLKAFVGDLESQSDTEQKVNPTLLASAMLEAGYVCTSSPITFKQVIDKARASGNTPIGAVAGSLVQEEAVAQCLGIMVRTHNGLTSASGQIAGLVEDPESIKGWKLDVFVKGIEDFNPSLDWSKVIHALDYENFLVYDIKGFTMIIEAWRESKKGSEPFPVQAFFGRWKHLQGELSALYQLSNLPIEVINLNDYPLRKVLQDEDVEAATPALRALAVQLTQQQANCLDLIESIVGLADSEVMEDVRIFLERLASKSPEVVFLALVQIQPIRNPLHEDLISRLLNAFLNQQSSSTLVFSKLWSTNPQLLVSGFLDVYNKEPSALSRILDISQELKILRDVLKSKPLSFSIDLAALASRREFLNLEKWLQDNIQDQGEPFVRECLDFLNFKVRSDIMRQDEQHPGSAPQTLPLTLEAIAVFLKVLHNSELSEANSDTLRELQNLCVQTHPRLVNIRDQDDPTAIGSEITFSHDVESEANSKYEQVYTEKVSVESMVNTLRKYKESQDLHEQNVFACMVHNLFDEYRFFSNYPARELTITSILFGSLVQYNLVTRMSQGIALRYVLDSLRKPPSNKMFMFGLRALFQFKNRLSEMPQYCEYLRQIPHLLQAQPELARYIMLDAGQGQATESPPLTSELASNAVNEATAAERSADGLPQPSIFSAINVGSMDPAEMAKQREPEVATQDKILFIINNLTKSNLDAKVSEMKGLLEDSSHKWFGNYLVVKRASVEPNNQELYLLVLDALNSESVRAHVLHVTFVNIKILLNSDSTLQSSTERTLLKNLGSWLGGLTLARNKPIKHKNIAFKELLLEGYDHNRLLIVIPFVCKVLEQSSKSKVFKPPNPWLMAIIKFMVELYQFAELKLNLKFEIEVLCKALDLDLSKIEPTSILKSRPPRQLASDRTNLANAIRGIEESSYPAQGRILGHVSNLQEAAEQSSTAAGGEISLPNFAQYISINPQLTLFNSQPAFRRLVYIAIDRAIREIIGPVVERSVTIASISCRELVLKDFANEVDETKMRKAALAMAQNLAGSLSMVTCKEPLRVSMVNHMRNLLLNNGFTEQNLPEQAIQVITTENIELACSVIEKAAMEKAIPEMDETLQPAYILRRRHRERSNQPFFDPSIYNASRYPANLPEQLGPKPNGLGPQQLRVYEDFARHARLTPQIPSPVEVERAVRQQLPEMTPAMSEGPDAETLQDHGRQIVEKFALILSELDNLIAQSSCTTFSALPQDSRIRLIVRQSPVLAVQSYSPVEIAFLLAQKTVQQLYRSDYSLAREVYVSLLERLCETSASVAKEVTSWILFADDDRKYNVPVTVTLLKCGFINVLDEDLQLAKLVDAGRQQIIEFAVNLIRACLDEKPAIATPQEFSNSLEALSKAHRQGQIPDNIARAVESLVPSDEGNNDEQGDDSEAKERLRYLFAEWVRLNQHPSSTDKSHAAFVSQLVQQGIFNDEETSATFFRVSLETCVEYFNKEKGNGQQALDTSYQPVDAFSKLIVLLVKSQGENKETDTAAAQAQTAYFTNVLTIIALVLAHQHEQRRHQFNQKPFLRLFACLLKDFNSMEQDFAAIQLQLLEAIGKTMHTLQPSYFPGFCFAWLQLISHRLFMPKLLTMENQKGWASFHRLLISLLNFLAPFLRNVELRETTRTLYRGALRVLLILLHDFPEFLCEYHFSLCDAIPTSCIQMRNLILSAFPRNMRLPDPFTPNLKVDLLPEINQSPQILSHYVDILEVDGFKSELDSFLKSRNPQFLFNLRNRCTSKKDENATEGSATTYNIPFINALVLDVGVQAIAQGAPITHSAPMDIFQNLLVDMDPEGRYLFLSAIANQLRYPNSHTHYFSCVLLYLFAEAAQENIKEQITRVLLERLIVNRPHPWGLLITFIELIKNPRYDFWQHKFTRCAVDIERLFESVSRQVEAGG